MSAPPPVDPLEILRESAATSLEQALGFVQGEGDELARMRARILLETRPAGDGVELLETHQSPDGSFPRLGGVFPEALTTWLDSAGLAPELLGSLEALSILADWRNLYSPCAERVVTYLSSSQSSDGGWGSTDPTSLESSQRLFLSAMLAGFAGRTRSARPTTILAARDYISSRWSVERIRREGWPLVAAFCHYYTNVVDENADVALPWCGRELGRGLQAGEYSARETMRVLIYCDASALPGADFDIESLLTSLIEAQSPDGSHAPDQPTPAGRIGPTLDAMLGLLRLCRTLPTMA